MNIMAGLGVAVREFQLTTGEADYGHQFGGIGRAYELFGDRLAEIMEELNARVADYQSRIKLKHLNAFTDRIGDHLCQAS